MMFYPEDEDSSYSYEDYYLVSDEIPERGCCIELCVNDQRLGSMIRLADSASWEIPELKVRQDSFAHGGYQGTVAGLLRKVEKDVEMMKSGYSAQLQLKMEIFLSQIRELANGNFESDATNMYHIIIRDPSGVSRVEFDELESPFIKYSYFERDFFENDSLGFIIDNSRHYSPEEQFTSPVDIAQLVLKSSKIVCISGAGISVESGIPPFRGVTPSASGTESSVPIWNEFDPNKMTVQGFNTDPIIAKEWWRMKHSLLPRILSAEPNSAHLFFSYLQSLNKLHSIITQNIDSLHSKSGVIDDNIIELHGHMRGLICSNNSSSKYNPIPYGDGTCSFSLSEDDCIEKNYFSTESCPLCPKCQAPLRTETVMFDQPIPPEDYSRAVEIISACDLLFVIGSSLIVRPVKYLPLIAQKLGIPLVLINRDETSYDSYATGLINQPAGEFLQEVTTCLQELISQSS